MTHQLLGLHHITAMTDDIKRNYDFMTEVLGMRLVKKTVNQDDIHTYHTFYADDEGNAGTDVTFFDFPNTPKFQPGTNSISRIGLRVPSDAALDYYKDRFDEFGIQHNNIETLYGAKTLAFEEESGQRYRLFSDENNQGVPGGIPWKEGPVPAEFAIYGLGPIEVTVTYYQEFKSLMENVYGMKQVDQTADSTLLEVGEGGHGGQMILVEDTESSQEIPGDGTVHHLAFRVKDEAALEEWLKKYESLQLGNSGLVDRFYFEALYARIGHILIELSTDGPGFMEDEPYETVGESLSLPPFLEPNREMIEAQIRPFDTTRPKKD